MPTQVLCEEPFVALLDSELDNEYVDFLSKLDITDHSGVGHLYNADQNAFRTSKTLHTMHTNEYLVFTEHIMQRLFTEFKHEYQINNTERIQFTRYDDGEYFKPHRDFHNQDPNNPVVQNDRIATVIVYITDDYVGGETSFPDLDITIYPKKGQMLYFTYYPSAPIESRLHTMHEGKTVIRGTKIIATQWFLEGKNE